ncbi:UNVERIFIED_ORG: hypothetical protein GGI57_004654 [Rhizobium aethiopicum]|uniref:Uncharacterized protein n=1 Tax=Rhizobium leguminosarum bv. trifolii TaxID=386 RepID=A0A3E1B0J6_RHILT|nr:hypothetical protein [Rhizobium leguminosarum]RFB83222.1 hypothetical protein B5K10_29925 [Rhizobium leguminosarum bv. trifolii]RFB83597.1 hypothetical protein B5K08_29930 [Rhizobium leguminosarum bv. trifolii]
MINHVSRAHSRRSNAAGSNDKQGLIVFGNLPVVIEGWMLLVLNWFKPADRETSVKVRYRTETKAD